MIILFKQISNKIPFEPSMCLLWEIATRLLENEKRKSKRQKKKKKEKEKKERREREERRRKKTAYLYKLFILDVRMKK